MKTLLSFDLANPVQNGKVRCFPVASDTRIPTNVTVNSGFLSINSSDSAAYPLLLHFLLFGPV